MKTVVFAALIACALFYSADVNGVTPPIPDPPREYRGAWCATVHNIDWPPVRGTGSSTVNIQKSALIERLDTLAAANMNAMYFQVRPTADALYLSSIEPTSIWLTGNQNFDPTWDPLAFAVEEAHKRGIELHAWVNPYRAAMDQNPWSKHPRHVMRARPDLCVEHGSYTYMDPGKQDSIDWIVNVVSDIVTRYDVDGVVFDDYFYPGTNFNDGATYWAYLSGGGTMSLDDWRRDNVDRLIETCYNRIHEIRNTCQFSVGPFGIWRPGYPQGVSGSDYYATHYCDTRKWLQNGWVDSMSPQLYWPTDSPGQPFGPLINWWAAQNPNRHVLASTAPYRLGDVDFDTFGNIWSNKTAQEILTQVDLTRAAGGVGNVHYSIRWLSDNHKGVTAALKAGPYAKDALRPVSWWLDNTPPPAPTAIATPGNSSFQHKITFSQDPEDEEAAWWVVYTFDGSEWDWKVLPGVETSYTVSGQITQFAVSAVDRSGNESVRSQFSSVGEWSLY